MPTHKRPQNGHSRSPARWRIINRKKVRIPRRNYREELRRMRNPSHRLNAQKGSYHIQRANTWTYRDHAPGNAPYHQIRNPISVIGLNQPHYILRDREGRPRYTLRYMVEKKRVMIQSIQRERTEYVRIGNHWEWSATNETQSSKQFQRQLGMQPAEFLLTEFLFRARKMLMTIPIFIQVPPSRSTLYWPLIARFCEPKPYETDELWNGDAFAISAAKKRVKALLDIP